jgi:ABC-type molybdenum transport system ATPase subunit/photorepair protein PhrA
MLHALETHPDVLNIALTGSNGAGKSSVLKTFFSNHPQFNHTYVSLPTFNRTQAK